MTDTALISSMQHFSTDDGDGIRTTIFMQGCNLKCAWCHNPETIPNRSVLMFYSVRCSLCGKCESVCDFHKIKDGKHFVDFDRCVSCKKCVEVCPSGALSISGQHMSLDEVYDFIAEDKDYYDATGGGVTFSGGEPLLQVEFLEQLAKMCTENSIGVYVDTAANVPFDRIEKLIPYTSKFLIDLKANCEEDYKKYTGGSLSTVLENIKRTIDKGADVLVRIPVIPNHNDSFAYLEKCGKLLADCGVKNVELLPFHRLGSGKYNAIGKEYEYEKYLPYTKKDMEKFKEVFYNEGVEVL